MRKKEILGVCSLLLVLAAVWILAKHPWTAQEGIEEAFTITALPVGKADALIVQESDYVILVDTGEQEDGTYILQALKDRGITRLDLLLVTHFDKDHVGSASYIMEQMEVDFVMMPDYEGDRPEYEAFLVSLEGHPNVQRLVQVTEFSIGEMQIVVYPAEDPAAIQDTDGEYDNDMSLVVSITYGMNRFLLTGDIEKTRIAQMLSSDVDWEHDWIKMPHHGKYQKALKDFIEAVQPKMAVICCSADEPYEEKTLTLLQKERIQVWDTSENTVVTVSDGERIMVRYE